MKKKNRLQASPFERYGISTYSFKLHAQDEDVLPEYAGGGISAFVAAVFAKKWPSTLSKLVVLTWK